jgi:hypothetical protein
MIIEMYDDKFRISQTQNPKSIQEMGHYNSTMAISTGFTVGLNVNNCFFSIRFHYLMSNNIKRLRGRNLNDLEKGME